MNENKHSTPGALSHGTLLAFVAETTAHFLDHNRSLFNNRARAEVALKTRRGGAAAAQTNTHKIKVRTMASLCAPFLSPFRW